MCSTRTDVKSHSPLYDLEKTIPSGEESLSPECRSVLDICRGNGKLHDCLSGIVV